MRHAWSFFEGGEWCRQCGTYRSQLRTEFDPASGEDLGKFYTYYEVGQEPRKVPESQGTYQCSLIPQHFRNSIYEWLRIREDWGGRARADASGFYVDAEHSALLRRILAGKPILPEPAPLAFSYPNYELIEQGWDEPYEVWTMDGFTYEGEPSVVIDQHRWRILETLGPDSWVVTYLVTDQTHIREGLKEPNEGWRKIPSKSRWHVRKVGSRLNLNDEGKHVPREKITSGDFLWRIDRIEDT